MCPKSFFILCFSVTVFPLVLPCDFPLFCCACIRIHVEISIDISIRATETQFLSSHNNPVNRCQWAQPPQKLPVILFKYIFGTVSLTFVIIHTLIPHVARAT